MKFKKSRVAILTLAMLVCFAGFNTIGISSLDVSVLDTTVGTSSIGASSIQAEQPKEVVKQTAIGVSSIETAKKIVEEKPPAVNPGYITFLDKDTGYPVTIYIGISSIGISSISRK
jgi:hypothetical protein